MLGTTLKTGGERNEHRFQAKAQSNVRLYRMTDHWVPRVKALTRVLSSDYDYFEVSSQGDNVCVKYHYHQGYYSSNLDATGLGLSLLDALESCASNLKHTLNVCNPNIYLAIRRRIAEFEATFGELP